MTIRPIERMVVDWVNDSGAYRIPHHDAGNAICFSRGGEIAFIPLPIGDSTYSEAEMRLLRRTHPWLR
jgi:hypothetical protein